MRKLISITIAIIMALTTSPLPFGERIKTCPERSEGVRGDSALRPMAVGQKKKMSTRLGVHSRRIFLTSAAVGTVALALGTKVAYNIITSLQQADLRERTKFFFSPHMLKEDFDEIASDILRVINEAYGAKKRVYFIDEFAPANWSDDPAQLAKALKNDRDKRQRWLDGIKTEGSIPILTGPFKEYNTALYSFLAHHRGKIYKMMPTTISLDIVKRNVAVNRIKEYAIELFFRGRYDNYMVEMLRAWWQETEIGQLWDDEIIKQIKAILRDDPEAVVAIILGSKHFELIKRYGLASQRFWHGYYLYGEQIITMKHLGGASEEELQKCMQENIPRHIVARHLYKLLYVYYGNNLFAVRAAKTISERLSPEQIKSLCLHMPKVKAYSMNDINRAIQIARWLSDNKLLTKEETDLLFRPGVYMQKRSLLRPKIQKPLDAPAKVNKNVDAGVGLGLLLSRKQLSINKINSAA